MGLGRLNSFPKETHLRLKPGLPVWCQSCCPKQYLIWKNFWTNGNILESNSRTITAFLTVSSLNESDPTQAFPSGGDDRQRISQEVTLSIPQSCQRVCRMPRSKQQGTPAFSCHSAVADHSRDNQRVIAAVFLLNVESFPKVFSYHLTFPYSSNQQTSAEALFHPRHWVQYLGGPRGLTGLLLWRLLVSDVVVSTQSEMWTKL